MTESVFAFMLDSGYEATAYSLTGNCSTMSYINLLRCADSVAAYSFGIHNTTHHVPFASRATQSRFATNVTTFHNVSHQPLTLHTSPWLRHLGQIHYPFLYQLTDWLHSEAQHHLFAFHVLALPCGAWVHVLSTTISFAVISAGLMDEAYLTVPSRLV